VTVLPLLVQVEVLVEAAEVLVVEGLVEPPAAAGSATIPAAAMAAVKAAN